MKEQLEAAWKAQFGDTSGVRYFFAPGRVNLIGEHTDYNGGHVFPCALTIGTYAAARQREDELLRFYSVNFPEAGVITVPLRGLVNRKEDGWTNYPKGVIAEMEKRGYRAPAGMDILYLGTIPNGSGLSSSASIEVLTAEIFSEMFSWEIDGIEKALLCQAAERGFNGVNCGIMDQFAIAMGKKDHAVFLDTDTLSYEYVPLDLAGVRIVIMNTNKKRGLGDSAYNERRAECEQALAEIQKVRKAGSLGELTAEDWESCRDAIASPVRQKRAKHAVFENLRTIRAAEALRAGDLAGFGRLMNESHISLRDDYEVTGKELDTLVAAAWEVPGVIGARMTGAGFGGCAVSLVKEEAVEALMQTVKEKYEATIGYAPSFYVAEAGGGPGVLAEC